MKRQTQNRSILAAIIIFTYLISFADNSKAQTVEFEAGVTFKPDSVFDIIIEKRHSAVCVTDWNEDGNYDILTGCFYYGYVFLLTNIGTNIDPVFSPAEALTADGDSIRVGAY